MRSMTNVLQDISPSGIIRPVTIASALIWFIIHLCIHGFYVCNLQFLIYYTLRFYFPYLSLLAQPVNITLYGPGLDCLVFDSVPERYLHYYFR
jgi:hypothetical protein